MILIITKLKEELSLTIEKSVIENEDYEALEQKLTSIIKEAYENKMSVAAPEQKSEIERVLYLQILDNAWREHLYSMDTLKTGIGLRGYNQKIH